MAEGVEEFGLTWADTFEVGIPAGIWVGSILRPFKANLIDAEFEAEAVEAEVATQVGAPEVRGGPQGGGGE